MELSLLIAQLPALLKAAEGVQATIAAIVRAVRGSRTDLDSLTDEQIVARLVSRASTGEANADALIDRLAAGQE